jgi:hypothetical protein
MIAEKERTRFYRFYAQTAWPEHSEQVRTTEAYQKALLPVEDPAETWVGRVVAVRFPAKIGG